MTAATAKEFGARGEESRSMASMLRSAGALLKRAHASFVASVASAESKKRLIQEFEYIKAKEMRMLEDMEYNAPSSTPSSVPTPPQSSSTRGFAFGGIAVLGGIGWYALAGTKVGQSGV